MKSTETIITPVVAPAFASYWRWFFSNPNPPGLQIVTKVRK